MIRMVTHGKLFPFIACSWFALFFASEVCVFPFINLFLFERGVTQEQIGFIGLIRPWAGMVSAPILSALADRYKIHRNLMIGLLISFNLIRVLLLRFNSFLEALVIIVLVEILGGPVNIFVDAKVTQQCLEEGEYGRYRLWGAVGWGGMSWLAGLAMDKGGIGASYLLNLSLVLPIVGLSWILMSRPPLERKGSSEGSLTSMESRELRHMEKNSYNAGLEGEGGEESVSLLDAGSGSKVLPTEDRSFIDKLLLVSRSVEMRVFILTAVVMGFGFGCIEGFLFLLLREMGASDLLLGLTLTVTCLAEVPSFLFQGWMIQRMGTTALLDICCFAYVVRMGAYALLPSIRSPWLVLIIEPLHGLTFACGWGAGTEMAKKLSPPGLESTVQGLFQGAYFGFGYGIGVLMGGLVSARWGYTVLYISGALTVLTGWMVARFLRMFTGSFSGARVAGKGLYLPLEKARSEG